MTHASPSQTDPAWPLLKLALAGQRHTDPEVRAMAETVLDWWWAGATDRLDRAVGIIPSPGQRSQQTQVIIARRDDLVRKLASDHYGAMRSHPAAIAICKQWSRYAASAWPRERLRTEPPPHRIGTPEALFWQIMKLQDRVLSERSVRQILAAS